MTPVDRDGSESSASSRWRRGLAAAARERATMQAEAAARMRSDDEEARESAAEFRARMAEYRNRDRELREAAAGRRLIAGAERERGRAGPDEREADADERDRIADQRDRVADLREADADQRDRIADERDHIADLREADANERETGEQNAIGDDYMPIVEPPAFRPRRLNPVPTAHAWSDGSRYVACRKRVGDGWIVHAVAWSAVASNNYARCPDCIAALERSRVGDG